MGPIAGQGRRDGSTRANAVSNEFFVINSSFSVHSLHLWYSYRVGRLRKRDLDMLKRSFRNYALSLAGGALFLGGSSVAAGAMTLPLPGVVTEQAAAAVVTDGAVAAKVEQVYWRGRAAAGWGWHRGWRGRGYGWRARLWLAPRVWLARRRLWLAPPRLGLAPRLWLARPQVVILAPIVPRLVTPRRRSPKARSASKALRVTFGATTPRSSLKFGHLCRQRTSISD